MVDPSFSPRQLDHTNKHLHVPHHTPKAVPTTKNIRYDNDISGIAIPLNTSPTKTVPRDAIPKSQSKQSGGILQEDLPLILSKVTSKKDDSPYILRRKAPRSPDSISGPEPILFSIEGNLTPFDIPKSRIRSLNGLISFRKDLGEGVFGKVRLGSLSGPALKSTPPRGTKENSPQKGAEKTVAVKSFTPFRDDAKLDREIAIVKMMMSDPPKGIPRLHGILRGDDMQDHLVMKYCNKRNISDFFHANVNNKSVCFKTLLDLMSIVENFHKAGFCHRDIWEENFLRHEKKKTGETLNLLTDFGHAENLSQLLEDGIGPDDENSMTKIPLQLRNCPRYVATAWREAEEIGDFNSYQDLIDKKGFEIDRFQFGIMLFRVATAENTHIARAELNSMQIELIRFLNDQFNYPNRKDPHAPKDVAEFLQMHFHSIPEPVRKVISGLLDTTHQMEFPEARKILSNFVKRFY